MDFSVKRVADLKDVAQFIALSISRQLELNKKVLFFVAGGSSVPVAVKVANILKNKSCVNLTVMLTDERYGAINHTDSNWHQLIEQGFGIREANLIPVLAEDSHEVTIEKFNKALEKELKADYKIGLFGVGKDGHTAGIFPDSVALSCRDFACGYDVSQFFRITITEKVIEKLDEAIIFTQGKEKLKVIKSLKKNIDVKKQPAQMLKKVPLLTIFTDI